MYGIVNQAIQGLITEKFGPDKWEQVKTKSNIQVDHFLNNESYDDQVTFKLANAAADVLDISISEVLIAFGEYWILETGKRNYGALLKSGGGSFKEFLVNLPNFHSRVMLMYPNLTPPEFKITNLKENELHLHYYSERKGLSDFVLGLIKGLASMFETEVEVDLLKSRDEGFDHEVFVVKWT